MICDRFFLENTSAIRRRLSPCHCNGKSRNFYCEQTILKLKINCFEVGILAKELGIQCVAGLKTAALCYTTIQSFAKGQVYVFNEFNFHNTRRKRQVRLSSKPDSLLC